MGADMLIGCFWEEIGDNGLPLKKPNWKKGFQRIETYCKEMLDSGVVPDDICHLGDHNTVASKKNVNAIQECLKKYLKEVQVAYAGNHREVTRLEFKPYRIFISGGMSWGDSPSELMNVLNDLTCTDILEVTGLNPDLPNGVGILRKLVKKPDLQPLLIGIDNDVDKMLDIEMRKPKRRK